MKKVFISRSLKPSSPIRSIIDKNNIIAQSLIEFSPLPFEAPEADCIFFYSRNGVKYFFEQGNYQLYPYVWACMSEGTADELGQYVTDVAFVGQGNPKEVAAAYRDFLDPDHVTCFIRAENSLDSIHKMIDDPKHFSIPVYQNTPTEVVPDLDFDILVFTSPMNADAWFNNRNYNHEKVISIGETTANHLIALGIKNVIIAEAPSEASIAKSLEKLI